MPNSNFVMDRAAKAAFDVWRRRQDSEGKLSGPRTYADTSKRDRALLYDQIKAAAKELGLVL